MCTAATTASVVILFVWSGADASFRIAVWKAKVCIGVQRVVLADSGSEASDFLLRGITAFEWDRLGQRVVAIFALGSIVMLSIVTLLYLTLRTRNAAIIKQCVFAVLFFVLFLVTRSHVDTWLSRRQATAALPRFKLAARALTDNWPERSTHIDPGLSVVSNEELYPGVVVIRGPRTPYPFRLDFGHQIDRGTHGILRFDLFPIFDSNLEYHPNGTKPTSYISGFGYPSPTVASYSVLDGDWYLVKYSRQ